MKIAFLGIGTMGRPIALNLLRAGHHLTVWNRTPTRCSPLVEGGARQAESPASAAMDADVVMYSLGSDEAIDRVVFAADGVLSVVRPGQVAIDLSTVHPAIGRRQAEAYSRHGADFLDAPVFGSKPEAEAGGLWIVIGGPRAAFERVRPVFAPISESVHYMGGTGMGAAMSMVGSLIVVHQLEALSEGMVLAAKAGLSPQQVLEVLSLPDFRSPMFNGMGGGIVKRDFTPMFALKHLQKDADLVLRLAEELNVPVPGAAVGREMIKVAINHGCGDQNASAIVKALELLANVIVQEVTVKDAG